jgi:hypothetical protein
VQAISKLIMLRSGLSQIINQERVNVLANLLPKLIDKSVIQTLLCVFLEIAKYETQKLRNSETLKIWNSETLKLSSL